MEPDPSVLIQGGVRRVISRRVEAVLIFHERYPSVAIGNNIQSCTMVLLERQGGLGPALSRASGFFWSWTPDVCMSVNLVIDRCTATRAAIRTPA